MGRIRFLAGALLALLASTLLPAPALAQQALSAGQSLVVPAGADAFQVERKDRQDTTWIAFWGPGSGKLSVTCPTDMQVRLAVEAAGSLAANVGPEMLLSVDDKPVFSWHVKASRKEPSWYVSPVLSLKQGTHALSLAFTNDQMVNGEDRNLYLGRIVVGAVTTPTALPTLGGRELASLRPVVQEGSVPTAAVPAPTPAAKVYPPYVSPVAPVASLPSVKLPSGVTITAEDLPSPTRVTGTWKLSPLVASATPFRDDPEEEKRFTDPAFNAASWEDMPVPLDWYKRHPQLYPKEKAEGQKPYIKGWYRATLPIPAEAAGNRVILRFEQVGYEATLWVNGKRVGSHHGDFTPAVFDITEALGGKREAAIALRVLSDFGPKWGGANAKHVYGSQWSANNIKGGVWGEVRLIVEPSVYLSRALITPRLGASTVEMDLQVTNTTGKAITCRPEALVRSALRDSAGVPVSTAVGPSFTARPGITDVRLTLPLRSPRRWSPEDPHLYYAQIALTDGARLLDARVERFGFREFQAKDRKFFLNGKRVYLFGENLSSYHFGGNGRDHRDEAAETLKAYKAAGYNMLRTPHQPIITEVLELADEVGMLIFDEWGWSFTDELDEQEFERHNLREVEEWVLRDYNYASVVMWSGGNEVHYDKPYVTEQFNKQTALIRRLDRSGRPVSVFDGAAVGYGKGPLDTDVYCYHDYLGLASRPWSFMGDQILRNREAILKKFGNVDKPVIVWECVGFSWGGAPQRRQADQPIALDTYLEWCNRPTTWGQPDFPAGVGMMGMRTWVDPNWGLRWGQEVMGKRIMEALRTTDDHIQGWAPWFHNPRNAHAPIWNAPLQCFALDLTTHPLVGANVRATLEMANDQDAAVTDVQVELRLVRMAPEEGAFRATGYREPGAGEEVVARWVVPVGKLNAFEHRRLPFEKPLPAGLREADYRLLVTTTASGSYKAQNFYEMAIGAAPAPAPTSRKKILVLDTPATPAAPVARALTDLGLAHTVVRALTDLAQANVLIVPAHPAEGEAPAMGQVEGSGLLAPWVESGGTLLVLEQNTPGPVPFAPSFQTVPRNANTLVDLAVPDHPAFRGMKQRHFDGWDSQNRLIVRHSLRPLNDNVIAATGHSLGGRGILAALVDARAGKGRVIVSQLEAVHLWKKDICATRYLANLLREAASETPWRGSRPLAAREVLFLPGGRETFFVDLKPFANRPLRDEVAEDGKGGWTDQGEMDLRNLPTGRQEFLGVPFQIIGEGNAALILRGKERPAFPAQITGIPVRRKVSQLFFLHTAAWGQHGDPGKYVVRYADGKSVEIPLKNRENIADWWNAADLTRARVAWTVPLKAAGWVGIYFLPWDNPREDVEVTAVDFVSNGEGSVPALLGITGLAANPQRLVVSDFEKDVEAWRCITHPKNSGLTLPTVEKATAKDAPLGAHAKVVLPAGKDGAQTITFTHFDAKKMRPEAHKLLTFWIKSTSSGRVSFVLPKQDWKDSLRWVVPVRADQWRKVSLNLTEEFKGRAWDVKELRGELFIYNEDGTKRDNPEVTFFLDHVQFE